MKLSSLFFLYFYLRKNLSCIALAIFSWCDGVICGYLLQDSQGVLEFIYDDKY